ncbi:MAG: fumarylacetoacetate hydrolase family protein [Planctomycetota bacterium]
MDQKDGMPSIRTIRDFYAFEQHVQTCRAQRGLGMIQQWYEIPVFYFSNPNSVIGHGDTVIPPRETKELDFELEIALLVGREAIDLPADDSALECICAMTIYNDWSARDLQRQEMAVGLGPAKGKDFANAFGPRWLPIGELMDVYRDGRFELEMRAEINGKEVSRGNASSMYWTWPQILAHASRDTKLMPGDVIGSGTVGTGCILELTPQKTGGWLQPGDRVTLIVDRLGQLENRVGFPAPLQTRK